MSRQRDQHLAMAPGPSNHPHALPVQSLQPTTLNGNGVQKPQSTLEQLAAANEQTWLLIGRVAETMGDHDHAMTAYENALRHNPESIVGLTAVAGIARVKESYPKAVEYFQRVVNLQADNGEIWSALGHCYLMQDDLQKAYAAYQQALYLLPNPKDPKLWYGIGILYDRYGSLDHAEEAFSSVLRMDKNFDKANEILFRLGIIYKQQQKYEESLACFDRILRSPPSPLAHADIWFQIGHVFEQQKDHVRAKDAYERVVADNPGHAKVLQQLGWLYHQDGSTFQNQELAIQYLTKSLEADPGDAQSWYLLGRAYMAGQKYNKAYEAYQQAVYRDGRNPTFWCSIGVLYFQINQFRDALDAYSRAIRINPYIPEVWFDLGSLYESCNNQISDAIDAYARAAELDQANPLITQRLQLLKTAQATGGQLPAAPGPQDVHPTAYASAVAPPTMTGGPPMMLSGNGPSNGSTNGSRPPFRPDSRGSVNEQITLAPPTGRTSPGPFGTRGPPPVNIDETRMSAHTPLAPMDVDRQNGNLSARDRERERDGGPRHHGLLLNHPVPQQQVPMEDIRMAAREQDREPSFNGGRGYPPPPSASVSPLARVRSPPFSQGPYGRPQAQAQAQQPQGPPGPRSPRPYTHGPLPRAGEALWERGREPERGERERERGRDWERDSRRPPPQHQQGPPPQQPQHPPFYNRRSPEYRGHSPPERSPISARGGPMYGAPGLRAMSPPREYERDPRDPRSYYAESPGPGSSRQQPPPLPQQQQRPPPPSSHHRRSESPRNPAPVVPEQPKERRKRAPAPVRDKDTDTHSSAGDAPPPPPAKRERKKRAPAKRALPAVGKGIDTPETVSSNGSSRSVQPSPTNGATPRLPSRIVDEDYDEGVADALMDLAAYRGVPPPQQQQQQPQQRHSPPRPMMPHRSSISSSRGHASPPMNTMPMRSPSTGGSLKRPLSRGSDEMDHNKRTRLETLNPKSRRPSSPGQPSTRPSPIPFRTQGHSPETPPLGVNFPSLPPHPRPLGSGHAPYGLGGMPLPPIATLGERERERGSPTSREGSKHSASPPGTK